jgi:glycine oxidase
MHVCIIGAGIIGVTAALRLRRAGARVTLIDAGEARTASLAAAGMLGACAEAMHEPAGAHLHAAALAFEAARAWDRYFQETPAFSAFRSDAGSMLAAFDEQDLPGLHRAYERAQAFGLAHAWRNDGASLDDKFAPALASLVLPHEARIEAAPMLRALVHLCEEAGVQFMRGGNVTHIARRGALFDVVSNHGDVLRADEVIVATGADNGLGACVASIARLIPAKGMLGVCAAHGAPLWPFVLRTPRLYAFAINDSEICFGATSQPGRDDLTPDSAALTPVFERLQQSAPGFTFGAARVSSVGVRPLSLDHAPLIGRDHADGPIIALGHGRNGWLLAPLTACMLEAHVFQHDIAPLWAAFQPDRFAS